MINRIHATIGWDDRDELAEVLVQAGLHRKSIETKPDLFLRAARIVRERIGTTAETLTGFLVPGRIEVLGKHTDYAGGRTIVAAAERGFCLVVARRDDDRLHITDIASEQSLDIPLSPSIVPRIGDWSNYPATVVRRVTRNCPGIRHGAEIAFGSDLPRAAGMSSSSALMIAVFLALAKVNDLWHRSELRDNVTDQIDLAEYLATIENGQTFRGLEGDRGVGTFGGSEDHTAILCCQSDHLSEYSYCPICFQRRIRLPAGYVFAIGSSGVVAAKTGDAMEKYNRASRLARMAGEMWRQATGRDDSHLAAILASAPDAADRLQKVLETTSPPETAITQKMLLARCEHFRRENNECLPLARDKILQGEMDAFGRMVDKSQRLSEELLGNQIPETMFLASSAKANGATAATAFGAGFGGSVWAMVRTERMATFLEAWSAAYHARFQQHAARCCFFATGAGPSAFQFEDDS